jgi:hypothetical protein
MGESVEGWKFPSLILLLFNNRRHTCYIMGTMPNVTVTTTIIEGEDGSIEDGLGKKTITLKPQKSVSIVAA